MNFSNFENQNFDIFNPRLEQMDLVPIKNFKLIILKMKDKMKENHAQYRYGAICKKNTSLTEPVVSLSSLFLSISLYRPFKLSTLVYPFLVSRE